MKTPTATKLPSGMWRCRVMVDGKTVSVTKPTKKEAEDAAALLKVEHRNGIKNSATGGNITLGNAIENYIKSRENVLSPSTVHGYRNIARNRFQSAMNTPLDKIRWQTVINTESRIASPKTIKNSFGLIRSVYTENMIELPPVRLPAPEVKEKLFLSPEQIPLFVEACHGNKSEIGCLLALSGLRRSEIYGLTWDDINLEQGVIHVHASLLVDDDNNTILRQQNKTVSSTRMVPIMIPALREALEAVPDKTGAVVTDHIGRLRKRITVICTSADLPDIGVHGLRHSFASLCYSLGIDEITCQRLGGWADYQTMRKIYTHLAESDRLKNIDKLSRFFNF